MKENGTENEFFLAFGSKKTFTVHMRTSFPKFAIFTIITHVTGSKMVYTWGCQVQTNIPA